MSCIFCDIVAKKVKSQPVLETDRLMAFKDIAPQAPVHLLVVPKKHVSTLNDLPQEDKTLCSEMMETVVRLATEFKIDQRGYRVVMNCNREGGQTVFHLHAHLLGGRQLGGSMVG